MEAENPNDRKSQCNPGSNTQHAQQKCWVEGLRKGRRSAEDVIHNEWARSGGEKAAGGVYKMHELSRSQQEVAER